MRHHIPKHYTVLISCTGRAPLILTFRPLIALFSFALPSILIATVIYFYVHKNTQLTQQNSQLTEEATSILQRLESLESRIKSLQDRTKTLQNDSLDNSVDDSKNDSTIKNDQSFAPQDETKLAVQAEALLDVANAQLPNLLQYFQSKVEPALQQTLKREEAQPKGMPLMTKTEISSSFGLRPDPFGQDYEFHQGIDFATGYGTPVYATAAGVVEAAEWDSGFGNHVVIDHDYGYRTIYAHLSEIKTTPGSRVNRYQVIGYSGSTGRSNGPHLHYGIYRNKHAVDPKGYLD